MGKAVETAYKAVMKPKEGTILTVAKSMALKADEVQDGAEDLTGFFSLILEEGQETLKRTPDMLPVLKEAGVVDSGGQGLMTVLEGCVDAFNGKELDLTFEAPAGAKMPQTAPEGHKEISTDHIKFGYCTEFIINLEKPFSEERGERRLEIIEEQVLEAVFGGLLALGTHQAGDGLGIGVDQFAQHMDA